MRSHHGHSLKVTVACALGALLAGCASGPPPQTTADLSRAHTLVAEADRSGAQEYAPADLQKARDEAQQADQLAGHGDAKADWLANEAAVDAQLADARAANGKAQHDLKDQRRTLETLRGEENRQLQAPPSGASPGETSPNGAQQPNQLQDVPPPPNTANPPNSFP
jgi:Domain of unknown function (DUF4398)